MASPPFIQLYVADFLADTQHLTTEEFGAYMLILMTMWRAGAKLPFDMKVIARAARLSGRSWSNAWQRLAPLFIITEGTITNKRLTIEFDKAMQKSALRALSGKLGGDAKALKDKDVQLAKATVLPQHLLQNSDSDKGRKKPEDASTDFLDGFAAPTGAPPSGSSPSKKGTRLLADFDVPQEWIDAGMARRGRAGLPAIDLRAEVENFVTYWPGVAGAKGLKLDWRGTFINGCIRARAPVVPYQKFGVVEGGGVEHASTSGWVTRLEIFNGLVQDSKKGSWSAKWGPQPGAKGCLVPAEAIEVYDVRNRPQASGAPR